MGLSLSGERLRATYHLTGDDAEARAGDICLEQTVEFPEDLLPRYDIREQIVGRVADLRALGPDLHEVRIEYPVEVAGRELTQLLNVLFGNISIKTGIRLVHVDLPPSLLEAYRGPRFGREGLRALLGVRGRPLLGTALKPMGLSPRELAELAHQLALGGMDLIKDDHGLADQVFCPFDERVARCAEAVSRAVEQTGRPCLYFPNVTGPHGEIVGRAHRAKAAGAGGVVVSPGLCGLDAQRALADDDGLGLPVMSHPALQGGFVIHPAQGLSHGVLFGQIARLAGADAVIFPSYGGRFSFTPEECLDLVSGTETSMGRLAPILPVPAGGMTLERVPELRAFYGDDAILLIGGALHRHQGDLVQSCRRFARLVGA